MSSDKIILFTERLFFDEKILSQGIFLYVPIILPLSYIKRVGLKYYTNI